ncbi:sensor histidine kinase [Aureispira anguillae]|uniref:sensor histidine kinase n=1 Tax=Aureispira anguillae TaxID=2864201 RepID=UPI00223297F6|nr:ATP-binding protein [Aureispira anguillae]
MIGILTFSCQKQEAINPIEEFEKYEKVQITAKALNKKSSKDKEGAYNYLDSIAQYSSDENLVVFANIKKVSYDAKQNVNKNRKFLSELIESEEFQTYTNYQKYFAYIILHELLRQEAPQQAMEYLMKAVPLLEDKPAIYFSQLSSIYSNIGYISSAFFDEQKKSVFAKRKGLEIALKYEDPDMATRIGYNLNVPRNMPNKGEETYKNIIEDTQPILILCQKKDFYNPFVGFLYTQLYSALGWLNQRDSANYYKEQFHTLYQEGKFNKNTYDECRHMTMKADVLQKNYSQVINDYHYLSKNLPRYGYKRYALNYNMMIYTLETAKDASQVDDMINYMFAATRYTKKKGKLLGDYNLKQFLDDLKKIEKILDPQKDLGTYLKLQNEIRHLDSITYLSLQNKTNIYKQQLDFWSNKEIEHANKQAQLEKSKARLWSTLFGVFSLFSFLLISLMIIVRKSKRTIETQKIELETITNAVPVGLAKINQKLDILWGNTFILNVYKIKEKFRGKRKYNYKDVLPKPTFDLIASFLKQRSDKNMVLEGAMTNELIPVDKFEEGLMWRKITYVPLKKSPKSIPEFIVMDEDHTDEKLVELYLEKQKKQIEESNQNLSRFAHVAAHDLKSPLGNINSIANILHEKYHSKLEEEDAELLELIIFSSNSLNKLVTNLLNFAKVSSSNDPLIPIDLNAVLTKVLKLLHQNIIDSSAQINTVGKLPTIKGRPFLLEQLFINLISNAMKYMALHTHPIITIYAENQEKDTVTICISDNGIGIDKKYHEEIFSAFKKLHSSSEFEGSGIGLATCKKIVEIHGGQIWVESVKGKGATFKFTLTKQL